MFPTRKLVLFIMWLSVSAVIASAGPSLSAPAPETADTHAAAAAEGSSSTRVDPSVGDAGQSTKPDSGRLEAADANQPATRPTEAALSVGTGESGTYLMARTVGGLGLVIGLIILGYVAIRRYGPRYLRRQGSQSALKVIETLPIGEKRSIALIQVEDKRLLIGNTQQQITLLAQLPVMPEMAAESGREAPVKANPGVVTSFRKLYEVEKSQSGPQQARTNALPQDLREKMRQLREAFEK